jgi:hypothetical protein
VKRCFLDYREAIGKPDGERAASLAAASTLDYFEFTRRAALSMPEPELRKRGLMDRLQILTIRARIPAATLRAVDGRGLFAVAVQEGMTGSMAKTLEPGEVELDGSSARLGIRTDEETLPPGSGFRLAREADGWKLDVISVAALAEPEFEQMLRDLDPDLDVALLRVLSKVAKKPIDRSIFRPLE